MTEQDKQAYLEWIDNALKNAHSSYTKVELYEKKIRFLEHALDERDREVERLKESKQYWRKSAKGWQADYFNSLYEIQRLRKALQRIVDESSCHGEDCTWGDSCFGMIARQALAGDEK